MIRIATAMSLLALALLGACNQLEDTATAESSAVSATSASPVATATPQADAKPQGYQPQAGTTLTLASGEAVRVLSVGEFDSSLKELSGLVAIEGRVKEAYPERGALILVDCANMAGCGDGCCPQAEVPVRLALSEFEGSLPAADAEVIVVGDLRVQDAGYELAVREIRRGTEQLLSRVT